MTTVVAIRKNKTICLASDSLAVFGERKENEEQHQHSKFIQLRDHFVGLSGHGAWELIFQDYFGSEPARTRWNSVNEIFTSFNEFHKALKSQYYFIPPELGFLPVESSELSAIIVNQYGIFEVDYSRTVREYKKYTAIGTGEAYAVGALEAAYEKYDSPQEIASKAIKAAMKHDLRTGGGFCWHEISLQ